MRHHILKGAIRAPELTNFSFAGGVFAAIAVVAAFFATPAAAIVVFDQSPALVGGEDSLLSVSEEQTADDFTLGSNTSVTAVRWWGLFEFPGFAVEDFSVRFFNDDGGVPESDPFQTFNQSSGITVTAVGTGVPDIVDEEIFQFDMILPTPVSLAANTVFHLSVINLVDGADFDSDFYWLLNGDAGDDSVRALDGEPWTSEGLGDLSFLLIGDVQDVPEPAALGLLFAGLLGLGAMRHRRSRHVAVPVDGV